MTTDAGMAAIQASYAGQAGAGEPEQAAGAELDFMAQIGVTLGHIGSELAAQRRARERRAQRLPIFLTATQTAAVSAAGLALVNLDGPGTGYFWNVRLITISDAGAWSNAVAGACQFCVGQLGSQVAPVPPHMVRWPFVVLPNAADFSRFEFVVKDADNVICQLVGGTPGQVIQATIVVEQSLLTDMVL